MEPSTRDRILAAIYPARRAPQSDYLTRIPCGILFVHGPPGCEKSVQLAGGIVLAIAQGQPVLLIASWHEAVDACLEKVEALVQTSGLDCVIIRAFDAAEDKNACKRVLFERDDWRSSPFRVRSRWRPRLSIAFWVGYFLGIEPSPWTGRSLDSTNIPPCFKEAADAARDLDEAPVDLPEADKSRLHNIFSIHLDLCIDHVYKAAMLVAVTPYGALGTLAKWFTRNRAAVLAVDEAAAIDASHIMQCVYSQSVFLFAFGPQQLPAFSASKTSSIDSRVNTYENQYILSLAERLYSLEWPIIVMDQQFRMLPDLFDPACDVFYAQRNIEDVSLPNVDISIATIVES